jgi:hypothetical protein
MGPVQFQKLKSLFPPLHLHPNIAILDTQIAIGAQIDWSLSLAFISLSNIMLLRKFNAALLLVLFLFVVKCHGDDGIDATTPVCVSFAMCNAVASSSSTFWLVQTVIVVASMVFAHQSHARCCFYSFALTVIYIVR